jgi:hypothetical protein
MLAPALIAEKSPQAAPNRAEPRAQGRRGRKCATQTRHRMLREHRSAEVNLL